MQIYLLSNTVNGKVYVGQTVNAPERRFREHCGTAAGSGKQFAIHRAIKKYGASAFSISVLATCATVAELNEAEIMWIEKLNSVSPNGYNLHHGGGSHGKHSEISKAKMSEIRKGWNPSEETRRRMSRAKTGTVASAQARANNSKAQAGHEVTSETAAKIAKTLFGHAISEETRVKISSALKGGTASEQARLKMSQAQLGLKMKPFSDEARARMSAAGKIRGERVRAENLARRLREGAAL